MFQNQRFKKNSVMYVLVFSLIIQLIPFYTASAQSDVRLSIYPTDVTIDAPIGDDIRADLIYAEMAELVSRGTQNPNSLNNTLERLIQRQATSFIVQELYSDVNSLFQSQSQLIYDTGIQSILQEYSAEISDLLRSELEFKLEMGIPGSNAKITYLQTGSEQVRVGNRYPIDASSTGLTFPVSAYTDTVQIGVKVYEIDDLEGKIETTLADSASLKGNRSLFGIFSKGARKRNAAIFIASVLIDQGLAEILKDELLQDEVLVLYRSNQWGSGRTQQFVSPTGTFHFNYRVDVLGQTSTPAQPSAQPRQSGSAYTNSSQWIYAGAGTHNAPITVLPASTQLDVVETRNGWSRVWKAGTFDGWIPTAYLVFLQPVAPPQTLYPTITVTPAPQLAPQPAPIKPASAPLPAQPANPPADLYNQIITEVRRTGSGNAYPTQTERFVSALLTYPTGVGAVSGSAQIGERTNALLDRVWDDWDDYGVDHMRAEPSQHGQLPFRQLVIRMVQRTQGPLSAQDQQALENFYTRPWTGDIRGIIGAIHRDIY